MQTSHNPHKVEELAAMQAPLLKEKDRFLSRRKPTSVNLSLPSLKSRGLEEKMNNCLECGHFTNNLKFCSSSCAVKYNNRKHHKRRINKAEVDNITCKKCGKKLTINQRYNKYCSSKCQREYEKEIYIQKWLTGEADGSTSSNKDILSGYVTNYLLKKAGSKCERCGWSEKNPYLGYPILEIHHIDGNRKNNAPENLVVLCPNCHSLTENYRAMNIKKKK